MLIKEQIKIARLIASGTPREVAIQEQFRGKLDPNTDVSDAIKTKVTKNNNKNKQQNLPQGKKGGEMDKPSPSDLAKANVSLPVRRLVFMGGSTPTVVSSLANI